MNVWILKETGEFDFEYQVPSDPYDEDILLMPSIPFMLSAPPECNDGEVAVGDNSGTKKEKWLIKKDNRGAEYWLEDGSHHTIDRIGDEVPENGLRSPPLSDAQKKMIALNAIVVTTNAGNTFDGDDTARSDMVSAIISADITGLAEHEWKLADNTKKVISLQELKEALALAIKAKGDIIL